MIRADYHVHTAFSNDSQYDIEDCVRDAAALGLTELCFTEHTDYGVKFDRDDPHGIPVVKGEPGQPEVMYMTNADAPAAYAKFLELRERYAGTVTLRFGMEFGIQTHTVPRFETLFSRFPFDFILLSVHQVKDLEFWTQDFQRGRTQREYNLCYYEEILALTECFHNYSVLAHLDLITRYDKAGRYPFENVRPVVTEILKNVIRDGKGIEINTSSWRYGLPDLTPSRDILKLYRSLGGRVLTVGSDSHKKAHLGAHIDEAMAEAKALGFTEFCTYEKMEPTFHKL